MICSECGAEGELFSEEDGAIKVLCRNCYYQPEECPHESIAIGTIRETGLTAAICTRCRTVRVVSGLGGSERELFEAGMDIPNEVHVEEFNGHWYIAVKTDLAHPDEKEPPITS